MAGSKPGVFDYHSALIFWILLTCNIDVLSEVARGGTEFIVPALDIYALVVVQPRAEHEMK
jgi:hypothetical protein